MATALTAQRLRELMTYHPETGTFTCLVSRGRVKVGNHVKGSINSNGYLRLFVDGTSYLAHRLAWLWVTGHWPRAEIDHINGVPTDNSWGNLREATRSQNCMNTRATGVSPWKKGKWQAHIDGHYLGVFSTWEAAREARLTAEKVYFGEFARAR